MDIRSWLGQVTTGGGIAALLGTVSALAAGQLSPQQAIPVLVAGAVGLIWPENTGAQTTAASAAVGAETLVAAYRSGLQHAVAASAAPTAALPLAAAPVEPAPTTLVPAATAPAVSIHS